MGQSLCAAPECQRGDSGISFEQVNKVVGVFNAYLASDFMNAEVCV